MLLEQAALLFYKGCTDMFSQIQKIALRPGSASLACTSFEGNLPSLFLVTQAQDPQPLLWGHPPPPSAELWVEATSTGGCLGMVDPPRLLYTILIYALLLEGCTCCSCRKLRQVKTPMTY